MKQFMGSNEWITTQKSEQCEVEMTPDTKFEVPDISTVMLSDLNDILTTAVEGGVGYWSEARNYRWENVDVTTVDLREIEQQKEGKKNEWRTITALDLLPILPRISTNSSQARGWNINEIIEQCDADIADIAVQLALFGQVKYG